MSAHLRQLEGDVPPDLVQAWRTRFVNRSHPYALQQADGAYRWVYEELTPELLAAHLRGEVTLALSSTDARGWCRWACLDVDVPGALPQLLTLRDALAQLGLPGLAVGSRRGGHLWLFLDEPLPAAAVRYALGQALADVAAADVEVPAYELYPESGAAGVLGHAVRLPLGIHRKTGLCYPPYDAAGLPALFTSRPRAAAFVLEVAPLIPAARVRRRWEAFLAAGGSRGRSRRQHAAPTIHRHGAADGTPGVERAAQEAPTSGTAGRVGTRSAVIRWVDAHVSPLDLLDELAPDSELRPVGRGSLGWCPFHDDRAADAEGRPGTPSFYAVLDRRYGWSWRCLSTNCAQHDGPMRHSFRLWQELLDLPAAAAVAEAAQRWPQAAQADGGERPVGRHRNGGDADGDPDDDRE